MRRKFPLSAAALAAALLGGGAFSQMVAVQAQEAEDPAVAEVNALAEEYRSALREWRSSAKEGEKPDPAINPARTFGPKFEALAGKHAGKAALTAWRHAIDSYTMVEDEAGVERAFGNALAAFGNEDGFVPILYNVNRLANGKALLEQVSATTTNAQVKAAAKFFPADALWKRGRAEGEDRAKARAGFEEVARAFPDTRFGKMAKGNLFEADRLQLGMKAPDIPIAELGGKKGSLADYRGKNLLLYFWATW